MDATARKAHTSALCFVPSQESWSPIQTLRTKHDKQITRWPPHINFLYPFVPADDFEDASIELLPALRKIPPFRVRFDAIEYFKQGRGRCVAWLRPTVCEGAADAMQRVHEACADVFPHCADVSSGARAFTPHLTVGQFASETEVLRFIEQAAWAPLECAFDCMQLIAREDAATPFKVHWRAFLGKHVPYAQALRQGEGQPPVEPAPEPEYKPDSEAEQRAGPRIEVSGTHVRMRFESEATKGETTEGKGAAVADAKLLFVIDKSYSMHLEYPKVKHAVGYMQEQTRALGTAPPDFVVYCRDAARMDAAQVLRSKPGYNTNFGAAFVAIQAYIEEQPRGSQVYVVFMTDGDDTATKDLPLAKALFRSYLQGCGRHVVVHTIGFTPQHKRAFLEEMRTMGSAEGVYRYAESDEDAKKAPGGEQYDGRAATLDEQFSQMFDFLVVTASRSLSVGAHTLDVEGQRLKDGSTAYDIVLPRSLVDPDGTLLGDASTKSKAEDVVVVLEPGCQIVTLRRSAAGPVFELRVLEEAEITDRASLDAVQAALSAVKVHKGPKHERAEASSTREVVQQKLDAYHGLFARQARGEVRGEGVAAQLASLRHEVKFAKARRTREMDQRACRNAKATHSIEDKLAALRPDLSVFHDMDMTCSLSGDSVLEVMEQSRRDFMCWTLRVTRPEHAIEAPTQLRVLQPCVGTYSNEAFRSSAGWAISRAGSLATTGGFSSELAQEAGLFKGPDGAHMNACLPLYLNKEHFARVAPQLPPIIAYFFTLDPLGFKADQYIALYSVLGQMLAMRANGAWPSSEWGEWLLADFTKLCAAVRGPALAYLQQGHYGPYGARGDLVQDFLAHPKWRSKQSLPELLVLAGWAAASAGADHADRDADEDVDACEVAMSALREPRLRTVFVEELWRRSLGAHYRAQPGELVGEVLEELLYGPAKGDADGFVHVAGGKARPVYNDARQDVEFADLARFKLGMLSKKERQKVQARLKQHGIKTKGVLPLDAGFEARTLACYADHAAVFDAVVAGELRKIQRTCGYIGPLLGGRMEDMFDGATRRVMLIQALQFCRNADFNKALEAGVVGETHAALAEGDDAVARLASALHARHEARRKETWAAVVRGRNQMVRAKQCVMSESLLAFGGRMVHCCPNRGGDVFTRVVALLGQGEVGGRPIPHHVTKVRIVMTGKFRLGARCEAEQLEMAPDDGGTEQVAHLLSNGESWVHCPASTAERLAEAVGEEVFGQIELLMHGTSGWVYRESDIPNRHGHSNSCPNAALVTSFSGFSRGRAARKEKRQSLMY